MTIALTQEEQSWLSGSYGLAIQRAMQILVSLGKIYGADRLIPISSAQVAGVSFDNLGDAGLEFLEFMANEGGKVRVLTTLNPAGMDLDEWQKLNIPSNFADNQKRVIDAYEKMGIISSCTCTPYLSGNLPLFRQHISWSESSAVCFANSVLGARTNREGGPSALASAILGRTPNYGYHLDTYRKPDLTFFIDTNMHEQDRRSITHTYGALGKVIGEYIQQEGKKCTPYICNIDKASLEDLKSFSASLATFGGSAIFHIESITPEASQHEIPKRMITISREDVEQALDSLSDTDTGDIDFVSSGCPHASITEIRKLALLLQGKKVVKEFWITTSRATKRISDNIGYTEMIESSGAQLVSDTCCVVAPIQDRFSIMATDSAKACYYGHSKNRFKTHLTSPENLVRIAVGED